MDTLNEYRRIVRELIEYYGQFTPANGDIQTEVIIVPSLDHYELIHTGWSGKYRVHGSVIHIDIRDGKVWIQYDGTNRAIADELVEAGIPRDHIVLAFKHPDSRKYTDFAVA